MHVYAHEPSGGVGIRLLLCPQVKYKYSNAADSSLSCCSPLSLIDLFSHHGPCKRETRFVISPPNSRMIRSHPVVILLNKLRGCLAELHSRNSTNSTNKSCQTRLAPATLTPEKKLELRVNSWFLVELLKGAPKTHVMDFHMELG